MIDQTSLAILETLQADARISNAEIGRRVGLAPSAVFERIRKLEERGAVRGYNANIDPASVDLGLLAFVLVRADERRGAPITEAALVALPEVQEVHHIAGEDCYLVKVRAADPEALGRLLRESFGAVPAVRSTRTTIVLETIREDARLPLPALERESPASAPVGEETAVPQEALS